MSLAIFDLDNTLLAGDSDHLWGEYLVNKGIVDKKQYQQANEQFYLDYQQGKLDIYAFCRFAFTPLKENNYQQLVQWRQEYIETEIKPIIAPGTEELLNKHRKQGDTLLIITATNGFITQPIAELLGIKHILATEPEFDGEQFTGELAGTPCFQEGKVSRLQQWLKEQQQNLQGSYFYSDSHNDLPLLSIVDHPVAVDPDDLLAQTAKEKGWKIISLR